MWRFQSAWLHANLSITSHPSYGGYKSFFLPTRYGSFSILLDLTFREHTLVFCDSLVMLNVSCQWAAAVLSHAQTYPCAVTPTGLFGYDMHLCNFDSRKTQEIVIIMTLQSTVGP